jgi:nitrite reductase/ring-hydroxylating ferredoxin subunit
MTEWRIGRENEVCSGRSSRIVEVDGRRIGIFHVGGDLYAYESRCPHQGGPVCQGQVIGRVEASVDGDGSVSEERFAEESPQIVCPWHGFEFDLATGVCSSDPRFRLRSYRVTRREGDVFVSI